MEMVFKLFGDSIQYFNRLSRYFRTDAISFMTAIFFFMMQV